MRIPSSLTVAFALGYASLAQGAAPTTPPLQGALAAGSASTPALPAPPALDVPPPLSPAESLKKLHLPAGFEAKIVACEPQVLDPVAFDWDAKGRMWVVEMADYPLGLDNAGARGGRIRILEDRDGDGVYETSTVFAEGLNFPTGILTWKGGAIVTAAPDILYLEDTKGSGRADKKEILFTGLSEGNQQLRANGLRWGMDNWVYVAAGGHHGKYGADTKLMHPRSGRESLVGSRDFRFRPDTGDLEAESGPTQFGRNTDDWGHWFGTQNSNPLWQYVLPDRYLQRNPFFVAPNARVQMLGGSNPRVYAASPPEKRYHSFEQAGCYTSACSGMIDRGSGMFGEGQVTAFVAEPFHNLVQQLVLQEDGVSYKATRGGLENEPDFFASEDRWCRPVMVRTGPDGALWFADMYRFMIEHPHWLPENGKQELLPYYRLGDDMGRIYRVTKPGRHLGGIPSLEKLEPVALAELLNSGNGWVRDKVQQMLLWRAPLEAPVVARLKALVTTAKLAQTRVQALWTVEGIGALTSKLVTTALADSHAGVRENALRLAENFKEQEVLEAALKLRADPDLKVRLQLAFSLGNWNGPAAGEALAQILQENGEDPFIFSAALSSALPHLQRLAQSATERTRPVLLAMALGAGERSALASLVAGAFDPKSTMALSEKWRIFGELLSGLARAKATLASLLEGQSGDALAGLLQNAPVLSAQAVTQMKSEAAAPETRIEAAALLARQPENRDAALAFLRSRVVQYTGEASWRAALKALADTKDTALAKNVLSVFASLTPEQRSAGVDTLLSRSDWTGVLLDALASAELRPGDLDASKKMQLANHPDKRLRQRAEELLKQAGSPSRSKVVEEYQAALALKGDVTRGHAAYLRVCAACHEFGKEGRGIGPHLASVAAHEPGKILANILDPNLDIQPGYHAYTCTLKTGEQVFGLLASENATGITFKLPDGTLRSLMRQDVASLKSTGVSLMPEGLENLLSKQDIADLISLLRNQPTGGN